MAGQDPFSGKEVRDADYVPWTTPGTKIVGVLRGIRDSLSRDNKPVHYLDIYIGKGQTVACSAPTTLYGKIKGVPDPIGRIFKIEFTHKEKTRGGDLKRFMVSALDKGTDPRQFEDNFWGVTIPEEREGGEVAAAPGTEPQDDLPF